MAPGDTASNQRSRNTRIDSSELFLPLAASMYPDNPTVLAAFGPACTR
jgi:hypothetical protein